MPIQPDQIVINGFYVTEGPQLRKVTGIVQFADGSERIKYLAKSDNIPNREFHPGSTLANPPTRTTFAQACESVLSANEVIDRRNRSIILQNE